MSARSDLQALLDAGHMRIPGLPNTVAANWLAAHGERVAALIDAADRVWVYHDSGGDAWWDAHEDLYAARAALSGEDT